MPSQPQQSRASALKAKDRADLLAVAQVLTELRFPNPEFLRLLGGQEPMIESPLLQRMMAEKYHEAIGEVLKARFDAVPVEVNRLLREILNEKKLKKLVGSAVKCPDLEAFRAALLK
jgi:hypothetical protein